MTPASQQSAPVVRAAETDADWATVEVLFREYLATLPFHVDFQDVDAELADLRSRYGPPRGIALLTSVDGIDVGAVGLTRFDADDAEMKRMYVRPQARGAGAGRALADRVVAEARARGYRRVLLDTVDMLEAAISLYESMGFRRIGRYRHNPRPDARFYALDLDAQH